MSSLEMTSAAASAPTHGDGLEIESTGQQEESKSLTFLNGKEEPDKESMETEEEDGDSPASTSTSGSNSISESASSIIKGKTEEKQKPINAKPPELPPAKITISGGDNPAKSMKKIIIIPNSSSSIPSEERVSFPAVSKGSPSTASTSGNKNNTSKKDSSQSVDTAVFKYCTFCRNAFLRKEQLDAHMKSFHPDKYKESPNSTSTETKNPEETMPAVLTQLKPKEKSVTYMYRNRRRLVVTTRWTSTPLLHGSADKISTTPPSLQQSNPKSLTSSPTTVSKSADTPNEKHIISSSDRMIEESSESTDKSMDQLVDRAERKMDKREKPIEQFGKKSPPLLPPPPQPFVCKECGKKFLVKVNYEEHVKGHNPKLVQSPPPLSSSEKYLVDSSAPTTTTEEKEKHSPKTLSSPTSSSSSAPRNVVASGLKCGFCDLRFPQPFLLRKHMEIHNQQYECSICASRYMKIEGLNLHMRVLHDDAGMNKFKCLLCDKKDMILMSEWYSHRLEKHAQVPFQVAEEKPFACNVCKQRFYRKGDAIVCALLGHDPSSLYQAMFRHKCPVCSPDSLGYHSIRALEKHWNKEHSDKIFPKDALLQDKDYSFDAPLPRVVIDKRKAYDLKLNGPPNEGNQDNGSPLIVEFDLANLIESNAAVTKGEGCAISLFVCPDCPLTFFDVESLTIHEQVHLQDEGPPAATTPNSGSTSEAKKRGRPPTKQNHFVTTMATGSTSPVAPISLLPPANGFRGKHLIAKYKCVTCGKKFRKLKRLRDHEQTHLNMDPNCATYPKLPGRGGRKAGLLKKKKTSTFVGGGGGIGKKRGRPRKIPFWVPSAAAAQQMKSGGGGGKGDAAASSKPENASEDLESPKGDIIQKPYSCKLCPAAFGIPKSLRMHELKHHNAPHKRPGRKPSNYTNTSSESAETAAHAAADNYGPNSGGDQPQLLGPGRIRVGRVEISTNLNKLIKKNTPIEIRVTDGNGETATHLQCPLCPRIFRDKRGMHLHILGHSLKAKENEKKSSSREQEDETDYQAKKNYQSPSAISSAQRRTSDRERRIPRKLSEYDVDDEEAAAAVGGASIEVESMAAPSVLSQPPPPQKVKKDGRGRPRKYPIIIPPAAEQVIKSDESTTSAPTTTFKEISGEIIGSRPRSKTLDETPPGQQEEQQVTRRTIENVEEAEEEHGDQADTDSEGDDNSRAPPPPPPRTQRLLCKTCGDTFDTVMELWCHGNEVHRRSKVKYVPNSAAAATAPKNEENKTSAAAAVVPVTLNPSQPHLEKPAAKPVTSPIVYPGKKNPAVLALLQKKREQLNSGINGVAPVAASPVATTKTVVNIEVSKEAGPTTVAAGKKAEVASTPGIVVAVEPNHLNPTTSDAAWKPVKGRPRKNKMLPSQPPSTTVSSLDNKGGEKGVMRIGQLKIKPEALNNAKALLEREPPEIIIKTTEDGQVIKRMRCPRCVKTFKDFRGLPFHMLCHIMKAEGKIKKSKPYMSGDFGTSAEAVEQAKQSNVDPAPKKVKKEQGKLEASSMEKSEKKMMPGLIPLGGIKKRGRPQKWIVNPFQKKKASSSSSAPPVVVVNGVKKVKLTQKEALPSTSRTSSILTTTGAPPKLQSSSENQSPPQVVIKAVMLEAESISSSAEAVPKPILSPTSNEFRFKIIKQSRILPFDDQLNQQQPSASTTAPEVKKPSQQLAPSTGTQSGAAHANVDKSAVKKVAQDIPKKIEHVIGKSKLTTGPTVPVAAITSLQTGPNHVADIQKKKEKMTAILAKAKISPEKPTTSSAKTSISFPKKEDSNVTATLKDVEKKNEDREKEKNEDREKEKKADVSIDVKANVTATEPGMAQGEQQTDNEAVPVALERTISIPTLTVSPETATLKRKRGRPRKDSIIAPPPPPPAVASSSSQQPVTNRFPSSESEQPTVEDEEMDNFNIDAEMQALERVERALKESVRELQEEIGETPSGSPTATPTVVTPNVSPIVSPIVVTPTVNTVSTPSSSPPLPPVKRKGRPPKKNKQRISTPRPPPSTEEADTSTLNSESTPSISTSSSQDKEAEQESVQTPVPTLKRKLGRPRKTPVVVESPAAAVAAVVETPLVLPTSTPTPEATDATEEEETPVLPIKRGRGRPRKSPGVITTTDSVEETAAAPTPIKVPNSILSPDITSFMNASSTSNGGGDEQVVRRGRGRPRKSMPILTRADNDDDQASSQ